MENNNVLNSCEKQIVPQKKYSIKKQIKLFLCIVVPLLVGGISGAITADSIPTWYVTLNKPFFNPPNYLFGPVWTTLYILMGISFFLAYEKSTDEIRKKAIVCFVVQLTLNFFWSIIFFGLQSPYYAFLEIIAMWCSIAYMIYIFYRINRLAAYLQIPYLLWVSFASTLNLAIWLLN